MQSVLVPDDSGLFEVKYSTFQQFAWFAHTFPPLVYVTVYMYNQAKHVVE